MKFSSGAKRQIEINHKVSNKEQTKMNKKHTKKLSCDRKIYSFNIAVELSPSHFKMIEWNLRWYYMGTRNDHVFIKDAL